MTKQLPFKDKKSSFIRYVFRASTLFAAIVGVAFFMPTIAIAEEAEQQLAGEAGPVTSLTNETIELVFWQSVKDTNDPAELEAYITAFPDGHFIPLARLRIAQMTRESETGAEAQEDAATTETEQAPLKPETSTGTETEPSQSDDTKTEADGEDVTAEPEADEQPLLPADFSFTIPPANEDRNWLGINMRNVTPKIARDHGLQYPRGVVIINKMDFAPAGRSNLQIGDVILNAGDVMIRDGAALIEIVTSAEPGSSIRLAGRRGNRKFSVSLRLGSMVADIVAGAQSGDSNAAMRLSGLLQSGYFIEADEDMADRILRNAANANNPQAAVTLARQILSLPEEQRDTNRAFELLRIAAAGGDAEWSPTAMSTLGQIQLNANDEASRSEGLEWTERAAEELNFQSVHSLAWRHLSGTEPLDRDHGRGMELMHIAADEGDYGQALIDIGVIYTNGSHGRESNRRVAISATRRAAELIAANSLSDQWSERVEQILEAWETTAYDPEELQYLLQQLGLYSGSIDGDIGRGSKAAIRQFQSQLGLEETGEPSVVLVLELRWVFETRNQ